jgi:exo-beta-1,3-glucanase (GH17 family)
MKNTTTLWTHGNAICYSGYRLGQSPQWNKFPSCEQIHEDLKILQQHWQYIRLYDCSVHAERVLQVISEQGLALKVMLGANMLAELENPGCPWGANFSSDVLIDNAKQNAEEIKRMIELANKYVNCVFSASIGNEASVDWTDHLVSVEKLCHYAKQVKAGISQPVTFCENYVPWTEKLSELAEVIDFISIHTYPVWEYQSIETALDYSKQNYNQVAERYPNKPIVITEAGWATVSNGRGINLDNASQQLQAIYYQQLMQWTNNEQILTFVFEAFDEPWKGSDDPAEPEKHWGLFTVDRRPKVVMEKIFADLTIVKEVG